MKDIVKANYLIDMHDAVRRKRSIYVATKAVYCLTGTAWSETLDVNEDDEIPVWNSSRMNNRTDVSSDMDQSVFAVLTPCIDTLMQII